MLKNKLYFTILICFVFASDLLLAQEQIFPLNNNPVLLNFKPEKKENSFTLKSTNAFGDTLLLPFVDDFSYPGPYPSGKNWLDSNVFINNTMGAKPPTWGVATFDGLNKNGWPYNPNVTNAYGVADTLTSKPIFLDYPAVDSIYLSFYYQPQGYGNNPQPGDSLVLEFKDSSGKWRSIWSAKGSVIPGDSLFKKVLIPITSLEYLRKGFQFRFKNYATLSGNLDHWHIDYIDIRRFRTYTDVNSDDVAFVSSTQNFLKDYKAVPYKHYTASLMNNSIKNEIVNLHSTVKNTSYKYTVHDKNGNLIYDYDGGNINIEPFSTNGIHNYAPHATPPANFSFPENGKCSEYIISHVVRAVPDINRNNDTLRVKVQLTDYFAYDDGTAEAAYGITQSDGLIAYKFEVTAPDTLNGVWIYFNPYIDNVSVYNFNLVAWSATEDGSPNLPITANTLFSNPTNNGFINGYWYYAFETPIVVNGVFFVGFKQQSAQSLNIGVDKHTKVTNKMYFNIDGNWNPSQFNYAWMIRPSFGNCVGFPMKIKETENLSNTPIILYPNPAEKQFSFSNASDDVILQIELYNQLGQKAVTFDSPSADQKLDISFLPAGIYTVNCIGKKNIQRTKLIIQ